MKIAFCLYGIVGKNTKSYEKGYYIPLKYAYNTYKKNLLDGNDVDVFIHSWSGDKKNEILNLYKPKSYLFEKIKYNNYPFLSMSKTIKLKNQYEIKNNITYDFVIVIRFDLLFLKKINFNKLDNLNIYVIRRIEPVTYTPKPVTRYDKKHKKIFNNVCDLMFISNSENANEFSNKIYITGYGPKENQMGNILKNIIKKRPIYFLGDFFYDINLVRMYWMTPKYIRDKIQKKYNIDKNIEKFSKKSLWKCDNKGLNLNKCLIEVENQIDENYSKCDYLI